MPQGWHRADIIAAIHKRGSSLAQLARENGLGNSTLRAALQVPRPSALIIAKFLKTPPHELWPAWFDEHGRLLTRKTGVSHTRFLIHPSEASAAIEALKLWLARDGGVEWPIEHRRDDPDLWETKKAVVEAQWRRLVDLEPAVTARGMISLEEFASKATSRRWDQFELCHFDQVQAALGRRLRAALEHQSKEQLGN